MKKYKRSKKFFLFSNDDLYDLIQEKGTCNPRMLYPKYAYVLHLIIQHFTYTKDHYERYGKRINVERFRKLFGGGYISMILKDLQGWGYIQLYKSSISGEHAATYKLTPLYERAGLTMKHFRPSESKFIKRLLQDERKDTQNDLLKKIKYTYENHVSISDQGLMYFRNKYPHPNMDRLIHLYKKGGAIEFDDDFNEIMASLSIGKEDLVLFSFLIRDFYVTNPEISQRVYSNICNLKRTQRQFIHLQDRPLLETDIACSQVVFSIPVIAEVMDSNIKDFQLYKDLALSGQLYEALAEEIGMDISNPENRKVFKKGFFEQIFFSKPNRFPTPIKTAFKNLFPSVCKVINKIKRGNHQRFAIELQNLESQLINFTVLKTLQDEGHIALSLHDAIYVNNSDSLQRAQELIKMAFKVNHGLSISFKVSNSDKGIIAPIRQAA